MGLAIKHQKVAAAVELLHRFFVAVTVIRIGGTIGRTFGVVLGAEVMANFMRKYQHLPR